MKLKELLKSLTTEEKIDFDTEIKSISISAGEKQPKSLFVCLKGERLDGHDLALEAVKNGAVCIVSERKLDIAVYQVLVKDSREALAIISAAFYKNPQKRLKIIGVVGTNGKTTTCHLINSILAESGKKSAIIGTLGAKLQGKKIDTALTTPDPPELFSLLKKFSDEKVEYVVMELSAHAIYLKKTLPIIFEVLIFTNCTHDHLDYFGDFEAYREVKKSIFLKKKHRFAVTNSDDLLGLEIGRELEESISYGIESPSDVFAVDITENANGISYVINLFDSIYKIKSKLYGRFNVYNTLAAASACAVLGVEVPVIAQAIFKCGAIEGRMEKAANFNGASVFVDYAHTPDGLEKSLLFLRKITRNSLYCLFGCGGNRDKTKRNVMGRVAGDIADYVIITSDNPRFEEPLAIISDIEKGLRESSRDYISIASRESAINYALALLKKGDTLLIAGKGAEEYQEIMGEKHPFSDKECVLDYIKNYD